MALWLTRVHQVLLVDYDTATLCCLYSGMSCQFFFLYFWAQFEKCLLLLVLIFVDSLTSFLLFLPAHFQIVSTATIELLDHIGFVCALILGFTVKLYACLYHWHKLCNVLCCLMQIIERQHGPCEKFWTLHGGNCFWALLNFFFISISFRDIWSRKVKVVFSVWFLHDLLWRLGT